MGETKIDVGALRAAAGSPPGHDADDLAVAWLVAAGAVSVAESKHLRQALARADKKESAPSRWAAPEYAAKLARAVEDRHAELAAVQARESRRDHARARARRIGGLPPDCRALLAGHALSGLLAQYDDERVDCRGGASFPLSVWAADEIRALTERAQEIADEMLIQLVVSEGDL